MLKITPTLKTGQTGKPEVQDTTMDNACKQCSYYIKGTEVFKFFVITKIEQ